MKRTPIQDTISVQATITISPKEGAFHVSIAGCVPKEKLLLVLL